MNILISSALNTRRFFAFLAIFALVLMSSQGIFAGVAQAANPSADLWQAENGGVGDPVLDPVDWVKGNVNATKGHYVEGQSIPYRMILNNLEVGVVNTLVIAFDVIHSNKFAIDYITSNDRIAESVNPCQDSGQNPSSPDVCNGAEDDTIAIPAPSYSGALNGYDHTDVSASFANLVAAEGTQYMKIWNGLFNSINYTVEPNLTTDEEAQVTVTFTPTATDAVISWGGHISSSMDYPGESAVVINGSPYHTRLISLNGSGGNQDRQLSADAVALPGNVTITKVVVNDNGGTKTVSDFPLFVGSTEVVSGVPTDFDAGTYTVSEIGDSNYAAGQWGGDCDPVTGELVVEEGLAYSCTITNDDIAPSLALTKVLAGGPAATTDFELVATGPTSISGDGTVSSDATFTAGVYTLTENDNYSGEGEYQAGVWQCDAGILNGNELTVGLGEDVSCSITNTYVPPKSAILHVVKNLVTDNGGVETEADFSFNFDGAVHGWDSGDTMTFVIPEANLGTYSVTEVIDTVVTDRYTVSYDNCTDIDLSYDGAEETCTITNDDIAPELTVIKEVINDDGTIASSNTAADFTMVVTATNPSDNNFAGNATGVTITLNAGSYSVDESDALGYNKTRSADCEGTIGIGESKTCTITNDDPDPTVTKVNFYKVVENNYGGTAVPGDFSFVVDDGNATTAVSHAGSLDLAVGNYTVSENDVFGYSLESISEFCTGGAFEITQDMLGKSYDCTFTNADIEPKLTVTKVVKGGDAEVSDFELFVGQTEVVSGDTNGFVAGDYLVTESASSTFDNYIAAFSGDCDVDGNVSLAVGEEKSCVITNSAYTITGSKWKDNNANGVRDAGENKLPEWTIIATNEQQEMVQTLTDEQGNYVLSLTEGVWIVSELQQSGWVQTYPENDVCVIELGGQTDVYTSTCDFGNQKLQSPELSCELTAAPNSNVASGSDVTLSWDVDGADEISLDQGLVGPWFNNDSAIVNPTVDTVYTLTARRYLEDWELTESDFDNEYVEVTCQAAVDISTGGGGAPSPRCEAFDAVLDDGVITLTWETRNGLDLTIAANGEEVYSVEDNDTVAEGSFVLDANGQTEFELTVYRGSKDDTCAVSITPAGQVLGEQVSIVPLGAADAGAGGTAPRAVVLPALLATLTTRSRKNA